MMRFLEAKTTFAAGELSEALHPREDLAKHQIGAAIVENMVVMVEGGLTRAPGTRFVMELKDETETGKLVPFRYSGADSYMLVFNGGVMRLLRAGGFVLDGAAPYELTVRFAEASMAALRWTASGNVIWLVDGLGAPQQLTRAGHASWTIADYAPENGPVDAQNTDAARTIQASAVTGSVTLTAVNHSFVAGEIGCVYRLDEPNVGAVTLWTANETGLSAGNQRRYNGNIYEVVSGSDAGAYAPTHTEGEASAGSGKVTWKYLHSGSGYVRITAVASATSATGTVLKRLPNSVVSGATYRWYQPAWSNAAGWPDLVALHNLRIVFARGDKFWTTKANETNDFETGTADDSALSWRLTAEDGSLVSARWMASGGVLAIGAADAEWMVRAPGTFDNLTPTSMRAASENTEGSAAHVPARVGKGALYIGRSRQRLHYAAFDKLAESLTVEEISTSARHILGAGVKALAWAKDPQRVCWLALEDGTLAAVTFMPEQQVIGWHRHPRAGFIEDIASIASSDEGVSEVYLIVRYTIDGQTRRYVERMEGYFAPIDAAAPTAAGAWFVQCALEWSGSGSKTISGLDHLEGETVAVFSNGRELPRVVVTGGAITLSETVTHALIGLPIRWRVKTLARNVSGPRGSTKGSRRRSNHVFVDMLHAAGGTLSSNDGTPEPVLPTGAAYGAPMPLFTGQLIVGCEAPSGDQVQIELVGDNALPFTLLGCSPDIEIGEG